MNRQLSVLSWNCREARSREFLREMKEFNRVHRPAIAILMKPKLSGEVADFVCRNLGHDRWIKSNSEGFSDGV